MTTANAILGIDHIQLLSPPGGEAAARAFWTGIFGLDEVEKPEPLRERGGAWFRCGTVGIHVSVDPDFAPAQRAHPAIQLRDSEAFDDLLDRLANAGHDVAEADLPIAERRAKTRDPFGNMIELVVGTTG